MSENVIEEIKKKLREIELKEDVTILMAVESGSRAWGFPSADSDYDVRFIYKKNDVSEYLRLEGNKDVIEWELNDVYDINGWDVDKALKLLHDSNPTVFEWLNSPIVYKHTPFIEDIRKVLRNQFQTIKGCHHYLSMAKKNYNEHLLKDEVIYKKYFYVLRPLLAVEYILDYQTYPPMSFKDLTALEADDDIKPVILKLLQVKANISEKDRGEKIIRLNEYIEKKLKELEERVASLKKERTEWEELDDLFLKVLNTEYDSVPSDELVDIEGDDEQFSNNDYY
ncbi:MAG: nucleotidyltransferase domain-containing protein [Erysipelotrichaceae bacterium]|nr:nucleotidyltransferase domain-containing protein [Erysipelotrichaceae bacterium]